MWCFVSSRKDSDFGRIPLSLSMVEAQLVACWWQRTDGDCSGSAVTPFPTAHSDDALPY